MENYDETPKSFIRWKNTSFRSAIATDMNLERKLSAPAPIEPTIAVSEPKSEPDVFTPIRQPRLPNGPGFAPRTRASPKIMKKIFYTDPKTNRALSNWEPGALDLCVWRTVDPEPSTEDLKDANDRKGWRQEIVYLNQIRQIRRVWNMCNAEVSKAPSDIERRENIYLDQIKQIRRVRMISTKA